MGLTLPYPTSPTNGDSLDATPILANETAIAQAIQSFDGSQVSAGTIVAAAMNASINPNTLLKETTSPFVYAGCVWSAISGLAGTMSGGTIYYNGIRVPVNSIASHSFTASKDTYVDIDVNGNATYVETTNGGTPGGLTANSLRVAKIITSGSAITSVVITGADPVGNIIYPIGAASTAHLQNPYKFNVYRNSGWTTPANANSIVPFDTKLFDTGNNVDIVTHLGRFTVPIAGFYFLYAKVLHSNAISTSVTSIFKNGSLTASGLNLTVTNSGGSEVSALLMLAANDFMEVNLFTNSAQTGGTGSNATIFQGFLVSPV